MKVLQNDFFGYDYLHAESEFLSNCFSEGLLAFKSAHNGWKSQIYVMQILQSDLSHSSKHSEALASRMR